MYVYISLGEGYIVWFPLNLFVKTLTPNVMILRCKAFERQLDREGGACLIGLVPYRKKFQKLASSLCSLLFEATW